MAGVDSLPTIRPCGSFNPERVAAKLQKAIKGIGTDEKTIIDVLTSHTNSQRQEIINKYKTMYGRDLVDELRKDLGGNFEEICVAMLIPYYDYMIECLYKSIKRGNNVKCIIDILSTHNNWDLKQIKEKFKEKYKESLEELLKSNLSGDFLRVLLSLINADRDDTTISDPVELAETDANTLYEAGVKRWGTDEDEFMRILCTRSFEQLRNTFYQYELKAGHSMQTAIEKEFSGEIKEILNAIVLSIINMPEYFARRLYESISGAGTDDETVIRILVSRSELDLQDIKDAYKKLYGKKLTDDISSDTSGDYRKLLLKIINP